MNEVIQSLVDHDRILIIRVVGPPNTGKSTLIEQIHGNYQYNRKYFKNEQPSVLASLQRVGNVTYLVQTTEHSELPYHVSLSTAQCSDINNFLISTRCDVDSPLENADAYESFRDGYIYLLPQKSLFLAAQNDLNVDWKETYHNYSLPEVKSDILRNFNRRVFGNEEFLQWLLSKKEAITEDAQERFCYSTVLVDNEEEYCRFSIFGKFLCCNKEVFNITGKVIGFSLIGAEEIEFRDTQCEQPYVLSFTEPQCGLDYTSHFLRIHKQSNEYFFESVEDADYALGLLPENTQFSKRINFKIRVNGRLPVFTFSYSFGLFHSAMASISFIVENFELLSEFDEEFIAFSDSGLVILNEVINAYSVDSNELLSEMIEKLGLRLQQIYPLTSILIRVVHFQYNGVVNNPKNIIKLLVSDLFFKSLFNEFLGFILRYCHVEEPLAVYNLTIEASKIQEKLRKICVQRRGRFLMDKGKVELIIPVIEEPGIQDELSYNFSNFQINSFETSCETLQCLHSSEYEHFSESMLETEKPNYQQLGDYLLRCIYNNKVIL